MRRIVILGAGGLAREIAWVIDRINAARPTFELLGHCDDAADRQSGLCGALPLLGPVEALRDRFGPAGFFCAVGDNRARQTLTARGVAAGHEPVTIVDPSAVVAADVELGNGAYVGIGSVVSVGARIGAGALINHHVCVGHDVSVGAFSQLCPGVCVSGGCVVEEGVLFGTLAGVIPLRRVGAWSVVGAGTVALRDVAEGARLVRLGAAGNLQPPRPDERLEAGGGK